MAFNIDQDLPLTESGAWADFQGSRFLIAHLTSIRFQRTLAQLQQPYRRKIDQGTMDPKTSKDIVCKAMAEGILLDWEGVIDKSGNQVAFSKEAALKALTINPEFREFVSEFAQNLENFRQQELEEVGKSF